MHRVNFDESRFWIDDNPDENPFEESCGIVDEEDGGIVAYTGSLELAEKIVGLMTADAMKKFTVLVREVHIRHRTVEAMCPQEALARATEDLSCTEDVHLEFSHTMSPDSWTVEGPIDDGKG